MENVLLITLSRQMTLRRELDVIANNVANAQTNGFKRRLSDSREYQMPVASDETFKRGGDRRVSFVVDRGTPLDTSLGQLEPTGNPLDAAINGDAYFKVQTPQGERYTRNGAMMVNARGELVNSDGHVMMGEQGVFQIANTERDLRVATDGSITSSAGNRGKLTLVRFPNQQVLENAGANTFTTKVQPEPALQARIQSGFVERSNVSPVVEISRMLEVTRQYQNIANMMGRADELRRSAIQKLGEPI
ncbi:MAG: flagellar biosynthesis protein FlgF [Rhizobiales bacterium PAR1]|nr:MAG: flagellar biosynthesis protein FlgF [Rhizobiales bacterium PAR1]